MQKISEVDVTIAGRRMPLRKVELICEDPSLTKQSFTKSADIRNILDKYAKTGILGDPNIKPIYGDFTSATSEGYQESLYLVSKIRTDFEKLPSKVRDRFSNDPAQLLAFMADPANEDESIKLGIRKPKIDPNDAKLEPPAPIPPPAEIKTTIIK